MEPTTRLSIETRLRLNSGHQIPVLGFGSYQLERPLEACRAAIQIGYRHLDSARVYRNEAAVADAILDCGIERDSLFLTTKVAGREHGYDRLKRALQDSVTSPKPEYWDLVLLHDPTSGSQNRIEAYRGLADAQKDGKAKSIGVSNFGLAHLRELEAAALGPIPAVNQIELHPWCQQRPIVEYCRSKGIVLQAYSPIARGKYMNDETLRRISDKVRKTPAQVLLRWSLQSGFVPLPKSDRPERMKENAEVFDFELDPDSMAQLDNLDRGDRGAVSWNPTSVP